MSSGLLRRRVWKKFTDVSYDGGSKHLLNISKLPPDNNAEDNHIQVATVFNIDIIKH